MPKNPPKARGKFFASKCSPNYARFTKECLSCGDVLPDVRMDYIKHRVGLCAWSFALTLCPPCCYGLADEYARFTHVIRPESSTEQIRGKAKRKFLDV